MTRWKWIALVLLILGLAGGVAGFLGWGAWNSLHTPFPRIDDSSIPSTPVTVEIAPGTGGTRILQTLEQQSVIASAPLARQYLIRVLKDPALQAGEYRFDLPMTTPEVLQQIIDGRVLTYPLTLIEGLTLYETAEQLATQGFGDLETFTALVEDPSLIRDLDPDATNLEGYLHPETYSFPRGATERQIVESLVDAFRSRYQGSVAPLLSEKTQTKSVRELVTLASIIEKEAKLDEERTLIASVYSNRLRIGMGLYADPTIIYALKLAGTWDGDIRRRDLKLDSPYNTYVVPGLPPTPIGSPGLRSLVAAAEPDDTPYLFFVSRNDGSHVFSQSLSEHNRNVRIWQKEYWSKRRAAERAAAKSGTKGKQSGAGTSR